MDNLFNTNRASKFDKLHMEDGECWFMPEFLNEEDSIRLEKLLLKEISWKQEEVFVYGKKHLEPRKTAWYGDEDCVYSYAGKSNQPLPWIEELLQIKANIESLIPQGVFNSVLLNLYRNGMDKMGWHSDNEKELGSNPVIASLSLGARRYFDMKHKHRLGLKYRFELPPGSLFVMLGTTQNHWLHQVPQQKKVMASRINLTFRNIQRNEKP